MPVAYGTLRKRIGKAIGEDSKDLANLDSIITELKLKAETAPKEVVKRVEVLKDTALAEENKRLRARLTEAEQRIDFLRDDYHSAVKNAIPLNDHLSLVALIALLDNAVSTLAIMTAMAGDKNSASIGKPDAGSIGVLLQLYKTKPAAFGKGAKEADESYLKALLDLFKLHNLTPMEPDDTYKRAISLYNAYATRATRIYRDR